MGIYKRTTSTGTTYYCEFMEDGKAVRRSLRTGTKAIAMQRFRELETTGSFDADGGVSLSPAEAWRLYSVEAGRTKRQTTIDNELMFWRQFWAQHKGPKDLYSLNRDDGVAFQDWLRRTPTRHGKPRSTHTINDALRHMAAIFTHMTRARIYDGENPFSGEQVPRLKTPKARPKFLTQEEVALLLAEAERTSPDIHLFYALGIYAGLRKGEMLGLRWRDIEWDRRDQSGNVVGCINVDPSETHELKTSDSQRVVPLHDTLRGILSHYRPLSVDEERFILKPRNTFVQGKRYRWEPRRIFGEVAKVVDRPVSPHALRHTFGSQAAMRGISIYKISRWMGHTSVTTTEIYAHLCPVDSDISGI